jgi:hypothetical protein
MSTVKLLERLFCVYDSLPFFIQSRRGAPKPRTPLLGWVFVRSSGGSVVLVDQPVDRGSPLDPGSQVGGLAGVVYRWVEGSASVWAVLVIVALELSKNSAQVSFTVEQQMVEVLAA